MKKIIPITNLGFLLLLLCISACRKQIDQQPTYTLNGDQAFNTIADYQYALTGAYSLLLQNSYYGSGGATGTNSFVCMPDVMSDNLYETGESLGNFTNFTRWTYTADDPNVEATWLNAYRIVQQANLTLRNIDRLSVGNPGGVNRIKAQAIALRAAVQFDLLRIFGEDNARNSDRLGIPYVDVYDLERKPNRLTVKESYDRLEADFKSSIALMQDMDAPIQSVSSTAGNSRSLIDELVVNAMLARMYNYAQVEDSAYAYASKCISARPLSTRTNFPLIWQDANTSEVIWSVKFEAPASGIGDNIYYAIGNRAAYRPTSNLTALYSAANDVRYGSYFQLRARGTSSRLVLSKYLSKQSSLTTPNGIVDFKVFRTGEMVLIAAEAKALMGGALNEASALSLLNGLRAARINGFVAGAETGTALLNAIYTERRKELVCEGQRFFDLKRTTRAVHRLTNCSGYCTLDATAREWAWPIPQSEILANPTMVQNTGY